MISAMLKGPKGASEKSTVLLLTELDPAYISSALVKVEIFLGMSSTLLIFFSGKGVAVVCHVGCIHVEKVDVHSKKRPKEKQINKTGSIFPRTVTISLAM